MATVIIQELLQLALILTVAATVIIRELLQLALKLPHLAHTGERAVKSDQRLTTTLLRLGEFSFSISSFSGPLLNLIAPPPKMSINFSFS